MKSRGIPVAVLKRIAARRARGIGGRKSKAVSNDNDNNANSTPKKAKKQTVVEILTSNADPGQVIPTMTEPAMDIEALENPEKPVSVDKLDTIPDALPLPKGKLNTLTKLEKDIGENGIETEEDALKIAMKVLEEYGDKTPGETLKSLGSKSLKTMIMGMLGPLAGVGALTSLTGLAAYFGSSFVEHIKYQHERTYGGIFDLIGNVFGPKIMEPRDQVKYAATQANGVSKAATGQSLSQLFVTLGTTYASTPMALAAAGPWGPLVYAGTFATNLAFQLATAPSVI
jgi:hypothetical protein